jgi:hypothetical protein
VNCNTCSHDGDIISCNKRCKDKENPCYICESLPCLCDEEPKKIEPLDLSEYIGYSPREINLNSLGDVGRALELIQRKTNEIINTLQEKKE